MCTLHAVVELCFWCRHLTIISRGGLKRGSSAFYYSVCSVCMTSFDMKIDRCRFVRRFVQDKHSILELLKCFAAPTYGLWHMHKFQCPLVY
jgi:hypothetical protein